MTRKSARIAVYDSEDLDGAVYEIPSRMLNVAHDLLAYIKQHGKKVCEFDSTLIERRPKFEDVVKHGKTPE